MLFEDRVALVTGEAQGIGRAIAHRFVAEGATVVLVDLQYERASQVAAQLGPHRTVAA